MRKIALLILVVGAVVMLLLAAEVMTLTGTVIDNKCAEANKADLANFIKSHPKECALMPACAASGYAIFADGKMKVRAGRAEHALLGARPSIAAAAAARAALLEDIAPIDDIRSDREYRRRVSGNVLEQFLRVAEPRFAGR